MKKRGLAILMALSLVMTFAITGCGSSSDKKAEAETEAKVIKVGYTETGKPWVFKENGEVTGFEGDMWKEISKRTGYEVEFVSNSFDGLFGLLDNGQVDTIGHFLGINKQRTEKYDFSNEYGYSTMHIITKKGDDRIKSIEDLKGKTIGVTAGSNGMGILNAMNTDGAINITTYDVSSSALQDVDLGRIDGFLSPRIGINFEIEKMGVDCEINPVAISAVKIGYPFRKDEQSAEFKEKVNAALEEMKVDGTVAKLSEKWYGVDVTTLEGLSITEDQLEVK